MAAQALAFRLAGPPVGAPTRGGFSPFGQTTAAIFRANNFPLTFQGEFTQALASNVHTTNQLFDATPGSILFTGAPTVVAAASASLLTPHPAYSPNVAHTLFATTSIADLRVVMSRVLTTLPAAQRPFSDLIPLLPHCRPVLVQLAFASLLQILVIQHNDLQRPAPMPNTVTLADAASASSVDAIVSFFARNVGGNFGAPAPAPPLLPGPVNPLPGAPAPLPARQPYEGVDADTAEEDYIRFEEQSALMRIAGGLSPDRPVLRAPVVINEVVRFLANIRFLHQAFIPHVQRVLAAWKVSNHERDLQLVEVLQRVNDPEAAEHFNADTLLLILKDSGIPAWAFAAEACSKRLLIDEASRKRSRQRATILNKDEYLDWEEYSAAKRRTLNNTPSDGSGRGGKGGGGGGGGGGGRGDTATKTAHPAMRILRMHAGKALNAADGGRSAAAHKRVVELLKGHCAVCDAPIPKGSRGCANESCRAEGAVPLDKYVRLAQTRP